MRPFPLAIPLLLCACGPMWYAEADSPEVCATASDVAIPGAGAASGVATSLAYELGGEIPVLEEPGVEYELRILDLRVAVVQGATTDLAGVERLRLLVLPPPGTDLPDMEVVSYAPATSGPPPTVIAAAARSDVDLAPYLTAGRLDLRVEYEGAGLPADAWTAEVRACFRLRVRLDYDDLIAL